MLLKQKQCEFCGAIFTPKTNKVRFCSYSCAAKWRLTQPGVKEKIGAAHTKPPTIRACEWCQKEFEVKWNSKAKNRFCSRTCSATWRMAQPEIKAKVHSPEVAAKRGRSKAAWFASGNAQAEADIERIRSLNPTKSAAVRAKISATMRERGIKPTQHGGNGQGPTLPQRVLWELLGDGWYMEYSISLGDRTAGYPTCYKVDIGNPKLMIAVEVDGNSHQMESRKAEDAKRDAKLAELGWKVLRFWNKDILSSAQSVAEKIQSPSTISK